MSNLPPPTPRKPIDPLIQQRVANLRRNQSAAEAPAPAARQKPVGRRVKPARASKVASLALSAITTVGLAGVFAHSSQAEGAGTLTLATTAGATAATTATTAATAGDTAASSTDSTATTTATVDTTAATTATTATSGQIADGTYVGQASSNRWGTVQVQAVYSGGQLVDVQILSYPDGDRKSVQINQRALPTLIDEAITAQSADVDTVSGATYTSRSYTESLQSAIDAALAASGLA